MCGPFPGDVEQLALVFAIDALLEQLVHRRLDIGRQLQVHRDAQGLALGRGGREESPDRGVLLARASSRGQELRQQLGPWPGPVPRHQRGDERRAGAVELPPEAGVCAGQPHREVSSPVTAIDDDQVGAGVRALVEELIEPRPGGKRPAERPLFVREQQGAADRDLELPAFLVQIVGGAAVSDLDGIVRGEARHVG